MHAGQDVLVGRHGEARVGVAEPFADDLDRHPLLEQQGGVGVAEVVEAQAGESAAATIRLNVWLNRSGCTGAPVGVAKT